MSKQNELAQLADAVTVDGGNVGIGTSSPSLGSSGYGLHIKGATNKDGTLKLDSTTANYSGVLQFTENGTDQWRIAYDGTNNHLEFTESGVADRMVIQDGGSVGIGTSSPGQKLVVDGNIQLGTSSGAGILYLSSSSGFSPRLQEDSNALSIYTNNSERMKIDGSGRVTMPYQPAFMAKKTSSQEQSATTNTKITFGDTDVNVGSHYNNTNHRFTAPVAGTYLFAINLRIGAESNLRVLTIALRKNGSELYGRIFGQGAGNDYGSGSYDHPYVSGSTIISLNANDYVEMWTGAEITYSGNLVIQQGNGTSQFMGYLIG